MSKKAIITAVAVFAFGITNAQDAPVTAKNVNNENVTFGIKGGLNISSLITNATLGSTNTTTGFHIGGIAEIKLDNKISIQPELLYSQEGGEFSYTDTFQSSSVIFTSNQKVKLSKINLPILFKYYVSKDLGIVLGPQLEYILSAKSETIMNFPTFGATIQNSSDMSENTSNYIISDPTGTNSPIGNNDFGLKKLNFGINIGADYHLKNNIFIQARYTFGLTNFVNNANVAAAKGGTGNEALIDSKYEGTSFKNSNFQISLGYKFD